MWLWVCVSARVCMCVCITLLLTHSCVCMCVCMSVLIECVECLCECVCVYPCMCVCVPCIIFECTSHMLLKVASTHNLLKHILYTEYKNDYIHGNSLSWLCGQADNVYCAVEQHMYHKYEQHGIVFNQRVQELYACLERVAKLETELAQFKQDLTSFCHEIDWLVSVTGPAEDCRLLPPGSCTVVWVEGNSSSSVLFS